MPSYVCAVRHERASVVKAKKHLRGVIKGGKKRKEVRCPYEERKQQTSPELKGTTVARELVKELFFCLQLLWYKNIIVNFGWPLLVALPCLLWIFAAWKWKFPCCEWITAQYTDFNLRTSCFRCFVSFTVVLGDDTSTSLLFLQLPKQTITPKRAARGSLYARTRWPVSPKAGAVMGRRTVQMARTNRQISVSMATRQETAEYFPL